MTAQEMDVIRFEGADHRLSATPLEALFATSPRPPRFESISTSRRRGYTATWAVDPAGLLFLTALDGEDVFESLALDGLSGWAGLASDVRRGRAMLAGHVGFVRCPLPDLVTVRGPMPVRPARRWLTVGDDILIGAVEPIAERWQATSPLVRLEGDQVSTLVPIGDAEWVDPTEQIPLADLPMLWADFPAEFLQGVPAWVRAAVPDYPPEPWKGSTFLIDQVVVFARVQAEHAHVALDDLPAYRFASTRPLNINDVVQGADLPLFASWFTGELRIVSGAWLGARNKGFESQWQHEIFLDVTAGRAVARREKHHDLEAPNP